MTSTLAFSKRTVPAYNKGKGKAWQWLVDHKDYPHDYCLIWPFCREPRVGRGQMGHNGKIGWSHRFMCELVHGPAPLDRPQAAHSCGNGHKGCVNPRHLIWKSNSENQLDRRRHGTLRRGKKNFHFSPDQIEAIRSQYGELTQMQLAEKYGCSLGTIQYYLKYREQRGHRGWPTVAVSNGESK